MRYLCSAVTLEALSRSLFVSIPVLLASSIASATLIQTADDFGNGDQLQFAGTVLSNDLINTGQATLAGVTATNYAPFSNSEDPGSPDFVLNDGEHGFPTQFDTSVAAFDADGEFEVTYLLDLTLNPLGYDLTRIRSYAAHLDNRVQQGYEVLVDFVSDGSGNFVSLGTFSGTGPGGTNQASRITLENDVNSGIDAFASGVGAIRFDVNLVSNAVVWREFDVEGVATVPEPSTGLLLALGLGGLAWRSRREH